MIRQLLSRFLISASLCVAATASLAFPDAGLRFRDDGAATQADERRTLITDESLRRSVLVDLERIPAGDRSAMRYFSLANLYNAGQTAPLLSSYREALLFVLNSLSWAPQPGSIAAVADTQDTIFRVDIRAFGLTSDQGLGWRRGERPCTDASVPQTVLRFPLTQPHGRGT